MNRNVSIIKDVDGNDIVVINDAIFKGRRGIAWNEVKEYLKNFVGDVYRHIKIIKNDIGFDGLGLFNYYKDLLNI